MEQRWEDSNKASNGKESVAKIGREGYLAKSCRTAMSCKLLEKKYFAKFLRFAKIFQTCLAKPSQYVANSQISQKQLHKCEGEEEALVRSDLLGLSSKSGAQVNFLWETSGQVVENQFGRRTNNLDKKKPHQDPKNLQSCQNTLPIQDKFKQRQIQRDETKLGSNKSRTSEKKQLLNKSFQLLRVSQIVELPSFLSTMKIVIFEF